MQACAFLLPAAILFAVAAGPARAEGAAPAPVAIPAPPHSSGLAGQTITYGELFAIGSGALVGTTLAAAVIDHGLGFAGTLLGAWAGDYAYFRYFGATPHPASVATP